MKVNHRKSAELNENPLIKVPDEIWKIILPLSARHKRESVSFELEFRLLSCVSRHWASIIDQLVPVYFSHIPYQSAWILSRFGSLTSLTIPHLSIAPDTQKIDDNFIEKFKEPIKNMTNLTSLIIKERYQSDSFTQYRTPDPFVCDSDWFRNLSNLTELEIPQCKSITNDDLSHLINLRSLKVCQDPWNFLITYEGVSKLTNLEILEVPHQKLIDINLSKLSSISHLILPRDSHIAIFDENPTMKALEGASNLKKLEMGDGVYEVKMGNLTNLTYLMINTSQKDKNLMTLTNLTHLDFGRITYTSSFRKISSNSISNLINLSTLVCHDCPSLLPAIPFLTNLTKLNIQDCATMPNNVHYISHLTNLTSLTSVRMNLSMATLKKLVNLRELDIASETGISNKSLMSLTNLHTLTCHEKILDNCVSRLVNLTSLNISAIKCRISDEGISNLTKLSTLICDGNVQITNHSISKLTNLTCLCVRYISAMSINFQGLRNLINLTSFEGSEGMISLWEKQHFPFLKSMKLSDEKFPISFSDDSSDDY